MVTQWKSVLGAAQAIVQAIALCLIGGLALGALGWSVAAALGLVPWWGGGAGIAATDGMAAQLVATAFLIGLCFFVPTNARVMTLETSHRRFAVAMTDVARAYAAAHAADRKGVFGLPEQYDSVRERLVHLRAHPDLGSLEPEILELAAQMSHESRDLAAIYADEKVARARDFLRQRQQEAETFQEHVRLAHATCHELRRWLEKVEVEESVARAQLDRLRDDLAELLPALGLDLTERAGDGAGGGAGDGAGSPGIRIAAE